MSQKVEPAIIAGEISERARALSDASVQLDVIAKMIFANFTDAQTEFDQKWPEVRNRPSIAMENDNLLAGLAQSIYRDRTLRSEFFSAQLFGEPAWDMLLDLFVKRVQGRSVSVTSAAIASKVPVTTALRWIGVLEEDGLIIRSACDADARRSNLQLTDAGMNTMRSFLRRKTVTVNSLK